MTSLRVSLSTLIAALTLFALGGLLVSLELVGQLAAARQQVQAWQALALHAPESRPASVPGDACSFSAACAFAGRQSPQPQQKPLAPVQILVDGSAVVEVIGSSSEALAMELEQGRLIEVDRAMRGLSF